MSLIQYKDIKFTSKTMVTIDRANAIIADYAEQGYRLTLRQIYYQFVSKNWIENSEKSYDRLGEAISNGRLAGLIAWDAIEDRTRNIRERDKWETPQDFARESRRWYHSPMWDNQETYVEAWIEKDALLGVLERPCWDLSVPYMSCRGYMSQSEEWAAAQRFEEASDNGKNPVLIYVGDHDPSGMDMTRDHKDRLAMFLDHLGVEVDVRRIALNIDQVHQYNPPPNPTKPKDSRSPEYVKRFGHTCWELDALQPSVIDALIRKEVDLFRDMDLWAEAEARREQGKADLSKIIRLGIEAFENPPEEADED